MHNLVLIGQAVSEKMFEIVDDKLKKNGWTMDEELV